MKLWHGIGLVIGILLLIGGSLALILQDNPRYASGEASAMVESTYQWRSNSADFYSDLYEEYLGQGIWEVKSSSTYKGEQAIFRVYETTDTVAIYNATAQAILNRREELEQCLKIIVPKPTTPSEEDRWEYPGPPSQREGGLGPNPFR